MFRISDELYSRIAEAIYEKVDWDDAYVSLIKFFKYGDGELYFSLSALVIFSESNNEGGIERTITDLAVLSCEAEYMRMDETIVATDFDISELKKFL